MTEINTFEGSRARERSIQVVEEDPGERKARLCVMNGPEDGRVIQLRSTPAIIGREESCDVALLLDQITSRRHAKIEEVEGSFFLEDLQSRNGTELNGIALTARVPLTDGAMLQVGETLLLFREPESETE